MKKELHPSISAVGAHLDQEIEKMASGTRNHKQTKDQSAMRESGDRMSSSTATRKDSANRDPEREIEEMMRLGQ